MKIALPTEIWRAVDSALADFIRFGPGELDAEYIPDEHLERARRAIAKALDGEVASMRQAAKAADKTEGIA